MTEGAMPKPCKCGSTRVARVNAKCSDMCSIGYGAKLYDGYVPSGIGITKRGGGGDYVEFDYCLDCGQMQGKFPISERALTSALREGM